MKSLIKSRQASKLHDLLEQCLHVGHDEKEHIDHPLIQKYGSPKRGIYIDESTHTINGQRYERPIILPLYDTQLNGVGYAVLQEKLTSIPVLDEGVRSGDVVFAYYGTPTHDLPLIVVYSLDVFFKLAQTNYAVVLAILPNICKHLAYEPNAHDIKLLGNLVHQLVSAGFSQLLIPFRNEQKMHFKGLPENKKITLVPLYQDHIQCELTQYESAEEVQSFFDSITHSIASQQELDKAEEIICIPCGKGLITLKKHGVYYEEEDAKGNLTELFISSPIKVLGKTRDKSNKSWGLYAKWCDYSGYEHTQAIPMEILQTDGAELRKGLANQGVMISPEFKARNLLQYYLMSYPTEQYLLCVDRVGWQDSVFVLPHKQIGQSANGEAIVYQSNNSLDNRYQMKGELDFWRSNVSVVIEEHSFLVFALCTAFSGQLLEPLEQQGRGFHFKGGSSKGKSTALNLAASVYGNPKHYYRTWRATGNALEHTAYMHNDGFLVLDEIGEISNPKELGNIVYMLSNGVGKARMSKQITAQAVHQWKLMFLSSGEKSMKDIMQEQGQKTKLGQEIRLIDIDVDQSQFGIFDCVDFAEDSAKQAMELNIRMSKAYGVAGTAWLEFLTSHKSRIMAEANRLLSEYVMELTQHTQQGHIARVAQTFALVAVAGELATQANITGWKSGTALQAVKKVFNRWLCGFEQVGNYEDREILEQIKSFFEANESSRFEMVTPDPDHKQHIINRVGYWKIIGNEKVFYVLTEQFKSEICRGYSHLKVAKVMMKHDLLIHDHGKTVKTVRLPNRGSPVKVYAVKEQIFSIDLAVL